MKKNNTVDLNYDNGDNDYLDRYKKILTKFKIQVGDRIKLSTTKGEYIGIVMPRYESSNECIVIKLKSGYNMGILVSNVLTIERDDLHDNSVNSSILQSQNTVTFNNFPTSRENTKDPNSVNPLPKILLLSTGGTIASKIDYRTGGVSSILTAAELYDIFPEISQFASIFPEFLFNEYSENLNSNHWTILSDRVSQAIGNEQYDGIIISHGTDTMHYTSAALSFALQNLPIPVVFVGSQRSSDRPSSDAFTNLLGAIKFITKTSVKGVFVCTHNNTSDRVIACYMGTRLRKNHTSRRDAFKSLDSLPFALIDEEVELSEYTHIYRNDHGSKKLIAQTSFDSRVFLLKFYPGFDPIFLDNFLNLDYKVIILEGTGLGHISKICFPYLKKLIDSGIIIFMCSQCIFGRVSMTVYDTGRDLLNLGIIPLSDMSSETAVVKAMWTLKNSKNVQEFVDMMTSNISNEITDVLPIV